MMTDRLTGLFRKMGALLLALGIVVSATQQAHSAQTRRYVTDDHGSFMTFGNTVGFDCRDMYVEQPVVGNLPGILGLLCGSILPDGDTGIDILWRSQYPTSTQATASDTVSPGEARSTAVFQLPAGAKVVAARLYWAAQRSNGLGAGTTVTIDRPGSFSRQLTGDAAAAKVLKLHNLDYYQSSADVTRELQQYGNGAYRVSGIQTIDIRPRSEDVAFVAWNIVVVYHLDSEPIRNISIFDGLDRVASGASSTTTVNLNGFSVPPSGFDAKLGVIAYEGDDEINGDQLRVNGTALTNAYNPTNNFFNRSSTALGALLPRTGDLPQMSGRPRSMSGYDSDTIDITNRVAAGDQSLTVTATTSGDEYFLGVFSTAVATIRPVFSNTVKSVRNLTRTDGRYLPGDTIEYTIATTNTGNDTGRRVTITDDLPQGITYVANSLMVATGANAGNKTDVVDADQGEYDSTNRRIVARLGTGATGTMGGDMAVNDTSSITFRATIDASALGIIRNQAFVSSIGQTALTQGQTTPVLWPSGSTGNPNVETPIVISTCNTNADCPITAPICDTSSTPHQCVCRMNSDCPGSLVCDPTSKQCVECIVGMNGTCNPDGPGGLCLPNNTCGCTTSADCNGRVCDTTTMTCAPVNTDLSVTLTRTPPGNIVPPGTMLTYTLTVENKGAVAINGAEIQASLAPNLAGAMWTCMGQNGASCPQQSGTAPLDALINVGPGGKLVYTFTATTSTDPVSSSLDFTGQVTPPRGYVDTNPADNLVTDSVIIGIPPLGPDLQLNVREEVSPDDSSVTYVISVTNHGPGDAQSATVTYDVPAGAQIEIMAGEGWSCDRPNNGAQVVCIRTQPILANTTTSDIRVHVIAEPNQPTLPVKITATAGDGTGAPLSDPKPEDNTFEGMTTLNQFKLVGGGFVAGCEMGRGAAHSQFGLAATLLSGLLGLALLARAARRSRRQTASN